MVPRSATSHGLTSCANHVCRRAVRVCSYVVNGAGGNREGNADPQAEDWVAFRSADRGFGRITITGATELQYQFVQNNGTVLDEFTITK